MIKKEKRFSVDRKRSSRRGDEEVVGASTIRPRSNTLIGRRDIFSNADSAAHENGESRLQKAADEWIERNTRKLSLDEEIIEIKTEEKISRASEIIETINNRPQMTRLSLDMLKRERFTPPSSLSDSSPVTTTNSTRSSFSSDSASTRASCSLSTRASTVVSEDSAPSDGQERANVMKTASAPYQLRPYKNGVYAEERQPVDDAGFCFCCEREDSNFINAIHLSTSRKTKKRLRCGVLSKLQPSRWQQFFLHTGLS